MFLRIYESMDRLWQRVEKLMIIVILSAMTFMTFIYTMLNNIYTPFYALGERFYGTGAGDFFDAIGDTIMDSAAALNWANEFTTASFAWLIFFGMSYGVRIGGHIGVDALVKLFNRPWRRLAAYIGLTACLLYGVIMLHAGIGWVTALYENGTLNQGLDRFGIARWHITIIVPIGFSLFIIRWLEIGFRLLTAQQDNLGLADEAQDAVDELGTTQDIDAITLSTKAPASSASAASTASTSTSVSSSATRSERPDPESHAKPRSNR